MRRTIHITTPMCGRFTHLYTWREIHDMAALTTPPVDLFTSYNVAPTQTAPVVREVNGQRRLDALRWGLVPLWAKDPKIGNTLINARADTVATKPAFRSAFASRRCLIPVSGFFEWKKLEGSSSKQPYYVRLGNGRPMFLAGLWERWSPPEGGTPKTVMESFTILTTSAHGAMATVHDRMPVFIEPDSFAIWLDPARPSSTVGSLLAASSGDGLVLHPVSTVVNSPKNNGPECVVPSADA